MDLSPEVEFLSFDEAALTAVSDHCSSSRPTLERPSVSPRALRIASSLSSRRSRPSAA
jgi:hypothetical protein